MSSILLRYRVFSLTWPAYMQIYWYKIKRLHKKRVQLPQDWFETPTWPPFHCFGTPGKPMFTFTLSNYFGSPEENWLHIVVVVYFSLFLTHLELKRSYTPVVPLKTIPDSRPNWGKCIPVCRPKQRQNPTRCGGTYLYSLYKWVAPRHSPKWRIFHTCNLLTEKYCFEPENDLIFDSWSSPHGTRSFISTLRFSRIFPDNWIWQSSPVGLLIP